MGCPQSVPSNAVGVNNYGYEQTTIYPVTKQPLLANGAIEKIGTGEKGVATSTKKYVRLRNILDDTAITTDTLHMKTLEDITCTKTRCLGSQMNVGVRKAYPGPRPKQELVEHAQDFIGQYYGSLKTENSPAHKKRLQEVLVSIEKRGTYDLTYDELIFGTKMAWRNAPRCIGRIQWTNLQVFDARHVKTATEMFKAICTQIRYGTNKGNIRSAITIFPARTDGKHDYKVWNKQFFSYAGYKQADGSVIGDPVTVEFTELCQQLGWKGKGGMFDILPLVLQAVGEDPEWFDIPQDCILEVQLRHPKYQWFEQLGLKWYTVPAVANMMFDCGGLEFTAAPFNGWYMSTEVGRDLCDANRYNILEAVANRMGLDTRNNSSLWKDRALVEANIAILHSYQSSGVTITDHHAASESFMKFMENEQKQRKGCPADWVWIVPPMSASVLSVFHQEMLLYKLKPSFEYQDNAWNAYEWKKEVNGLQLGRKRNQKKIKLRELAIAVSFAAMLMKKALSKRVKCTILYATETGKSEGFAKTLCQIFKHTFDATVMCMDEYDIQDMKDEALILIVTSTFGNGNPPENGKKFSKSIEDLKTQTQKPEGDKNTSKDVRGNTSAQQDNRNNQSQLSNTKYSVFGLGSSAYPHFCAFAHDMDTALNELGSEKILKTGEGDELSGQDESFRKWAREVFQVACKTFGVGDDSTLKAAIGALSHTDLSWSPGKFRLLPVEKDGQSTLDVALSKLHGKKIHACKLLERQQLQAPESIRQTLLARLGTQNVASEMQYAPGDHVAVFPENSPRIVDGILARLQAPPALDQVVMVEMANEKKTPLGTIMNWETFPKFPLCTVRTALSRFLDITTPPSQTFLKLLAAQAEENNDKVRLENMANDMQTYEEWKFSKYPHLLEVLEEFPSIRLPAELLMTQLPVMLPRYYSISSSLNVHPGEIHVTVAVVEYKTQGETGPLHQGVCSSWFNRIDVGEVIPCFIRPAPGFHMPEDNTSPLILVGPGTGIAPFRSFWQQRKSDKKLLPEPKRGQKKTWGGISLYRGCRQRKIDAIYEEELISAQKENVLANVFTALSREPDIPKTYVQDLLQQNGESVFKAIFREEGHFYVCGDVQMASEVTYTLENILRSEGKMTEQDARNFILKLKNSNRFHEDIFGVTWRSENTGSKARRQSAKGNRRTNVAGKPSSVSKASSVSKPSGVSKGNNVTNVTVKKSDLRVQT